MNQLIIFIKNPEKGKVKTRLAASIGEDKALEAYRMMLRHTRETALAVDAQRHLYYTAFVDRNDEWAPADFNKQLQSDGDLGQKMENAFAEVLPQGPAVIIGSDCLDLAPAHLETAFQALETHDFVIGPAMDGGYYLLGMRSLTPALFRDKSWSTETVFPDTVADIHRMEKSLYLLPELSDVDYESDLLQALQRKLS